MTNNNVPQTIFWKNWEKYTFWWEVDEKFREELNWDYENYLKKWWLLDTDERWLPDSKEEGLEWWTMSEQLEFILKNREEK